MNTVLRFTFILVFMGHPLLSHAFPEMVRHGYSNCITCHVSPNGGGIVTPYGRALSQEILSAGGTKDWESKFAYGAVDLPKWLQLGGDVRVLQTHLDTPNIRLGKLILMQADFEAAVNYSGVFVAGTIGTQQPKEGKNN